MTENAQGSFGEMRSSHQQKLHQNNAVVLSVACVQRRQLFTKDVFINSANSAAQMPIRHHLDLTVLHLAIQRSLMFHCHLLCNNLHNSLCNNHHSNYHNHLCQKLPVVRSAQNSHMDACCHQHTNKNYGIIILHPSMHQLKWLNMRSIIGKQHIQLASSGGVRWVTVIVMLSCSSVSHNSVYYLHRIAYRHWNLWFQLLDFHFSIQKTHRRSQMFLGWKLANPTDISTGSQGYGQSLHC